MAKVRKRAWTNTQGKQCHAFIVDYVDNRGERQRKQFLRYKEADKFRIKIEGQMADGTYRPDADRFTLKEVCEAYLEHCEGRMRRNERMARHTYSVYRGHVRKHLLNAGYGLTKTKLSQLTAKRVGDFRDGMRDAGVSVVTARKILTTLHGILEYAVSQDLVAVNAARGVKVIGGRDEGSKKVRPPSKEDMQTILGVAPEPIRQKIVFAASTGLRAGEQWALRWEDVDFKGAELKVRRRVDVYGEEGPPKTAAGIRNIPLSEHMIAMLKRMKLASEYSKDDDYIFPDKNGGFTRHDNFIKRRFNKLFSDNGNDAERFNWHALRHFAVSTWIEADLAPKTIQTFAGHSSLQVTMDRYGHMFKSDDHKMAMDSIAKGLFS
tara:strand:+ start:1009 stop:2142 length:1134 start_codon:yes stop_codon:yes gene_type:complete